MRVTSTGRYLELYNAAGECTSRCESSLILPANVSWGPALAQQAVLADDLQLLVWAWQNGCELGDTAGFAFGQRRGRFQVFGKVLEWLVDHLPPDDSSALVQAVQHETTETVR